MPSYGYWPSFGDDDDDGWTTGQIVGTAVGVGVAVIVFLALGIWQCVLCARRNQVNNPAVNPANNNNGANMYGNTGPTTYYNDGGANAGGAYYGGTGGGAQDPYVAGAGPAAPPPNTYGIPVYGNDGGYGGAQYYAPNPGKTDAYGAGATPGTGYGGAPPPLATALPLPQYNMNGNAGTPSAGGAGDIVPLGENPFAPRSAGTDAADANSKVKQKEKDVSYVSTKKSDH